MKISIKFLSFLIIIAITSSCANKTKVDLILVNGIGYSADSSFSKFEAFAVKDGKFLEIGTNDDILKKYTSDSVVNAEGNPVYPGFIDPHCHFYGYAIDLNKCQLIGTKSWNQVIEKVVNFSKDNSEGWLLGRAWDQNDWVDTNYPTSDTLNALFPDRPVFLMRVDGHAALVNNKALEIAGLTIKTKIIGGEIVQKNGKLTGLLIDNALDLVKNKIPDFAADVKLKALQQAEKNCFSVGLTTVSDAGLPYSSIRFLDSVQQNNGLKMRMYCMAEPSDENIKNYVKKGPYQTSKMNVRSLKVYVDGALGSRGAFLIYPYNDRLESKGTLITDSNRIIELANLCMQNGFQLNTHCIGDGANRLVLKIMGNTLKIKNDKRWRIEHAQLVHEDDMQFFGRYNIIPSMQPTHATSDMGWVYERVGDRLRYGYALKRLLDQNNIIALGSDFPVEDINPLYGFHAATARQNDQNQPIDGFQYHDKLTRKEAFYGMTLWAAYANFEDKVKGSIQPNKFADFVILNNDILTCKKETIRSTKVLSTFVAGVKVYQSKSK